MAKIVSIATETRGRSEGRTKQRRWRATHSRAIEGSRPLTATEGNLIATVVELLMLAGVDAQHLREEVHQATTRARRQHARPINKFAPLPWWAYGRVLSVWHQLPVFTDGRGEPRPLPIEGKPNGFGRLVARALPGHDPREILMALQELRLVKRVGETVLPNARAIVVKDKTQMMLQRAVQMLDAFVSTLRINVVQSRATRPGRGLFERAAFSEMFDLRHLRELDSLVRLHGQSLLEFLDSWLAKHEAPTAASRVPRGCVGVGIYVFAKPSDRGRLSTR